MTTLSERAALAPTGKLRVGIMYTNPVVALRRSDGTLGGISVALARELGRHIDTEVELVGYENTATMFDQLHRHEWDVAFTAVSPEHAELFDFTVPYLEADGTYLVPASSALHTIEEVDCEGTRIAVSARSSLDAHLSRSLRHAVLVRTPGAIAAFHLLREGKADVLAGVRQRLAAVAPQLPGSRILNGRFMIIENALAIPKNRGTSASIVHSFVEHAKASGLVTKLMEDERRW